MERWSRRVFSEHSDPLVRGRDFNQTDDVRHPRVAIVSSSLAERLFPNGDSHLFDQPTVQ